MREHETRLVDRQVPAEEQIEVDRPRAPPLAVASTAEPALDVEEEVEQRSRREVRLERERAVQVRGLLDEPQGSVSRSEETPTTTTSGDEPTSSTARRIVASRSPRFAPRPT